MESITIGQIAVSITFLVGLISGIAYLKKHIKNWISNALEEDFRKIDDNQAEMKRQIREVDMNACKNFLVRFLADVECGDRIDEIEKERFWEEYQHYVDAGGNSYIKNKVEQLHKAGKL